MGIQINGQTDTVTATDGSINVGGDVTIPGVLTYEDVTNIDSVGIITARQGIVSSGVVTATAFHGDGSQLTGIDATQIVTGNTSVQTVDTGSDGHVKVNTEGSERLRIDSSGRLLVGSDTTITDNNFGIGNLQVTDTTGYQHVLISGHSASAANATCLSVGRSRGSQSSPGYLSSGDHIARLSATSYNGGNYQSSGCIDFYAADQHASNDLPGYIALKTVPDGSATLTERLRIQSNGRVGINRVTSSFMLDIVGNSSTGANCIRIVDGAETGHGSHPAKIVAGGTYYHEMQMHSRRFTVHTWNGSNIAERFRVHQDGTVTTGGLSSTPGTVAAGSFVQAAANAGFFSNGIDGKFGTASSHPLYLQVNGVTKATVNTAGNMGVGISDPSQARLVAQTASGMSIAAVKDNTGASISLGGVTQPRILLEAGASASQFKLYTASGSSYSSAGWRQRLHVTDTSASVSSAGSGADGIGCFGINDTSPDSKALALSLRGTYGIEDPRPLVYLQRSYGVGGGSSTDETTLEISAPGSYNSAGVIYGIKCRAQHNLNGSHYAGHFENHGSQYSANGTSALYAKTTKLDTNGSGDVIAFRADASITTGIANNGAAIAGYFASGNNINGRPIVCQNGLTSNNWANQITFRKHNGSSVVEVGSIKSSNTATQYNTSSDYRLKENIVSLTGAIDRLKQLQPKRFNFIGIDETIDGFIAHEVNPVAPYAVSGEKDAVKKELVLDEDGNEQFDENGEIIDREVIDPQSVDYGKLTTLTIAALQEALAKIETLEAKVADLEES